MDKLKILVEKVQLGSNKIDEEILNVIMSPGREMYLYLDFFQSQFSSLESVERLLNDNKHKDCFILLRSVFESYLFLLQMVKGKKYIGTRVYPIIPDEGNSNPDARDKTLEKWRDDVKNKRAPHYEKIINLNPRDKDKIEVKYGWEGLFDEKDKDENDYWISRYYFAFQEYDSEVRFLSNLPSISAGDWKPETTKKIQEKHKEIYHSVFYFDKIVKNLIRNDLIDEHQKDRIMVHYNFLSSFTHPSKNIFSISNNKDLLHALKYENSIVEEQILLYSCKLQMLFLRLIVEFFKNHTSGTNWSKKYDKLISELEKSTDYFWFIFNSPTKYDIHSSDQKKMLAGNGGIKVDETLTIYYTNPLKRLRDYKSHLKMINTKKDS